LTHNKANIESMSALLRTHLHTLEGITSGFAVASEITGTDLFYTDGAAEGAEYKIYLYKTGYYNYNIYVRKDGTWFCLNETDMLKKWIALWLESIKPSQLASVQTQGSAVPSGSAHT
jgi:hypothetical protein